MHTEFSWRSLLGSCQLKLPEEDEAIILIWVMRK